MMISRAETIGTIQGLAFARRRRRGTSSSRVRRTPTSADLWRAIAAWLQRTWIIGLVLTLLGAAWLAHLWGPGDLATPDSSYYLDGARHLASGKGFTTANAGLGGSEPQRISLWPPGLSGSMVPGIWAGLTEYESASLVLALTYILYAGGTYLLLVIMAGLAWWPAALVLTAVLAIHPEVLKALDAILSDLPAAAWTTIGACIALRLVQGPTAARRDALILGACLACALAYRWAALYICAGVGVGVFLSSPKGLSIKSRVQLMAALALVPLLAGVPWLVMNVLESGSAMGARSLHFKDPMEMATKAYQGLASGFSFTLAQLADWRLQQAYVGSVVVSVVLILALFVRERLWRNRGLRLLLITSAGYTALLIATASLTTIYNQRPDPRFWLPVWPLGVAIVLGILARSGAARYLRTAAFIAVFLPLGITLHQFQRHFTEMLPYSQLKRGFLHRSIRNSFPVRYVMDEDLDCLMVSNDARVLIINKGFPLVHTLPVDLAETLSLFSSGASVCIVYFTRRSPASVEQRRAGNRRVLQELFERNLIGLIGRDRVGEIWVSR